MVFIFRVDGNKLTGIAHMSYWPGDTDITDGKVDGDRISFTALGKLPWGSTSNGVTQGGYPKLRFDGLLTEGVITFKLDWGSMMFTGEERAATHDLPMRAQKVAE